MAYDLVSMDTKKVSEAGSELVLKNPATKRAILDEEGKPLVFTLLGKHSEKYINTQMRISNRRLKEMRGRGPSSTAEELEDETLELLSNAIIRWSDNFVVDGAHLECTVPNARKVLSDPRLRWIRDQVDEHIGDLSNFFPES